MSKLNRLRLKELIIQEIKNIMDEEIIFSKNAALNKGMLNRHDDPGRQSAAASCYECGAKMYEDEDESVCEQCGSRYESLEEGHHHGAYMAKSQLYKVAKYSEKLYHMIPEGHDLEDWMRTKLAQIADDMSEVYHALDHDLHEDDI